MGVVQGGFARRLSTTTQSTTQEDRPKVNVWINIGYMVDEGTEQETFVSLPTGIALDTMKPVNARSSNQEFADFQAARNDMLAQFQDVAAQLEPGQDYMIKAEGGLAIQIRRVKEETPETVVNDTNRFATKLFKVA